MRTAWGIVRSATVVEMLVCMHVVKTAPLFILGNGLAHLASFP